MCDILKADIGDSFNFLVLAIQEEDVNKYIYLFDNANMVGGVTKRRTCIDGNAQAKTSTGLVRNSIVFHFLSHHQGEQGDLVCLPKSLVVRRPTRNHVGVSKRLHLHILVQR